MPTMSLRDEAPEGAPSPCETMVRRNQRQKPLYTRRQIVVSANWPSFIRSISMPIAIPAGPRNVVGPTGHQSPWWVGAPTPGHVSGSGHIPAGFDRALKHIEEAARHCTHAKTPPGESIGLPRSSTGSERVAGFEYRSPWWRVRGVQRPGVFEESLVPPAPDPRGTVPPPVTGVPARTRRASPYVLI